MGKFLLITILTITAATALVRPWIGIIAYYVLALLGPQYIWFWIFESLRVSYLVAVLTIVGVFLKVLNGQYDLSYIKTKLNMYLVLLFGFVLISYFFGSFGQLNDKSIYDPDELIQSIIKMLLFYFCAALAINDLGKLRFFFNMLVMVTIYFIYWANYQYFTSNWSQFNFGRLMGPHAQGSIYGDENAFGMMFVCGLPFIYYSGIMSENRWLRYLLWGIIPFGWHAIFLTASRGALLALCVTTILILLQNKKKLLIVLLLPIFIFFYEWQSGSVMKERSATISSYEEESSAESRLTAWKAGFQMVADHPITGVGVGSFMTALPHYVDTEPRIAHNTFVQYLAESGVGAGFCYLAIAYNVIICSIGAKRWCEQQENNKNIQILSNINYAASISFIGLFVCSMFLTLNYYEIYYYLLIVVNSIFTIINNDKIERVSA